MLDDPDEDADGAKTTTVTVTTKPDAAAPPPAKPDAAPVTPTTVVAAKDKPPKPTAIDRFHFKQDREGYLGREAPASSWPKTSPRKATRLTTGDYDEGLPAWSPDGKTLAFASNRAADPDRTYDSNVYVVKVAATPSAPTAITTYEGEDNPIQSGSYPAWSPDGREVAYIQGGPVKQIGYEVPAAVPAAGGKPRR